MNEKQIFSGRVESPDLSSIFALSFEQYHTRLVRYVRSQLHNKHWAMIEPEDVVMEAWKKAWENRETYDESREIFLWMVAIVRNTFRSTLNSVFVERRNLHLLASGEASPARTMSIVRTKISTSIRDTHNFPSHSRVRAAMRNLSDRERQILKLIVLEESTIADAARVIGINSKHARVLKHRILTKLRDKLNPDES